MVTAAHCLYEDGEQVGAKTLSILLGLHDRSKKTEMKRSPIHKVWYLLHLLFIFVTGNKLELVKYLSMKTTPILAVKKMI